MKEKTFKDWTTDELIFDLGLKEKEDCVLLEDWLTADTIIEDWQLSILERLLAKAKKFIKGWNEAELQTKYIAHITELVDFDNLNLAFSAFSERRLEAKYKGITLKRKVDWMVAIGRHAPRMPFFFIHEYKKQEGYVNDPQGQLLATMLAAYSLNQHPPVPNLFNPFPQLDKDMPVYGGYVIGPWWYFLVLHEGGFCISKAYNSIEKEELLQIVRILKKQKAMIIERLAAAKNTVN